MSARWRQLCNRDATISSPTISSFKTSERDFPRSISSLILSFGLVDLFCTPCDLISSFLRDHNDTAVIASVVISGMDDLTPARNLHADLAISILSLSRIRSSASDTAPELFDLGDFNIILKFIIFKYIKGQTRQPNWCWSNAHRLLHISIKYRWYSASKNHSPARKAFLDFS